MSTTTTTARPARCAILGTGLSATVFHIPFILAHPEYFTLHSILERKATPEHSVAREKYGPNVKVVTTFEEVLRDEEVDVVVVGTPNGTHYEYAKAALEASKHVIIEKPLTPTSPQAASLVRLARSKGLILAVYQNRRYDSDFLTLRRLLEVEKVFGEVVEFESRYDRFRPRLVGGGTWKEVEGVGQGAVFDLGSHIIDQVLTLFGPPSTISGLPLNSRQLGSPNFTDSFHATFYYAPTSSSSSSGTSGTSKGRKLPLVVNLHAGILSLMNPQLRFVVKGTEASWVKYGLDVQEPQLRRAVPMGLGDPEFGVEPKELEGTLTTLDEKGEMVSRKVPTEKGDYTLWYKSVGRAIQARDPSLLSVKPEEGLLVIQAIEAIYESHRTGKVINFAEFVAAGLAGPGGTETEEEERDGKGLLGHVFEEVKKKLGDLSK